MKPHPLEWPTLLRHAQLAARGRTAEAEAVLRQALALEPNLPRVHLKLAGLRWPGPDYRHWLGWLHRELMPGLYLEIGVEKGESLALARPPTRSIGVDPGPAGDPLAACSAPTQLFAMPSVPFLRDPPRDCWLHGGGFDLAFVDGDHRFEAVLDDLVALAPWAAAGSLVVLHDTLPLTALTASPHRRSGFYTGDGWKLVPCLRALCPALELVTLPVAPTGLTLVAGLERGVDVLRQRRADILESYAALDAQRIVERPEAVVGPLGVTDPGWVRRWLADAGVRSRS